MLEMGINIIEMASLQYCKMSAFRGDALQTYKERQSIYTTVMRFRPNSIAFGGSVSALTGLGCQSFYIL